MCGRDPDLVSACANDYLVPKPLRVGFAGNTVVFNLADVFFMVGNAHVTATLMAAAVQNRHRLGGWERTLLARLRT